MPFSQIISGHTYDRMPMSEFDFLLPTKLTAPRPQAACVRRDQLLARLGAADEVRLILVVAPAGFGKSTLVAQWLAEAQTLRRFAWLTLDEYDQDGRRFLAYVAGAIERAAPASLPTTLKQLAAADPPLYQIIQILLAELSAIPGRLTLVIDDYHAGATATIHQAVMYVLRYLPPNCQIVLLSRLDPPLALARLRAERQVLEIRAQDLRLSEEETGAVLARLGVTSLAPGLVRELYAQTEGWPIAVQLAAIAQHDSAQPWRQAHTTTRQLTEYLADEVLARQPAERLALLLALAVPERFCAGLCAALLGTPEEALSAESRLEELVKANLFMIALDGGGHWYRFHHLFRDLLVRRLRVSAGPERIRELHRRAAAWLEAERLTEEAVRQHLAAGDEDAAAELIERMLHRELGRDVSSAPPQSWMSLLPPQLIARRPGLSLIEARVAAFHNDLQVMDASLDRAVALAAARDGAPPPWPAFRGDLAVQRGILRYWQGRPEEAVADLWEGLRLGAVPGVANTGMIFLGRAYASAGRFQDGLQALHQLASAAGLPARMDEVTHYAALCMLHELVGRTADLMHDARRLAELLAARAATGPWLAFSASYLARAAYEQSDLATAAAGFAEVQGHKYATNAASYAGALIGLAMVAAAQGRPADVAAYEQELCAFAAEVGGVRLRNEALGCSARLALMRGDHAAALSAATQVVPERYMNARSWYVAAPPELTQAAARIAVGGAALLAQAEATVDSVLAEARRLHNLRPLVCALAVQALLRRAQGRLPEALAALEEALLLAEPHGYVRTFVDLGPDLLALLGAVASRGVAEEYLARILAARSPQAGPPDHSATIAPRPSFPEQLTRREGEILALLAARWSDKEIAEHLVITLNTVRKHTSTIYGKLDVTDRRQAVAAARALGLLPPQ